MTFFSFEFVTITIKIGFYNRNMLARNSYGMTSVRYLLNYHKGLTTLLHTYIHNYHKGRPTNR